jgi:SAM-dependent methyltransferase
MGGQQLQLQARSRQPASNQKYLHPRLATTVRRHLAARSLKPVAPHNVAAFELLRAELAARPRPLVLDSFCGTGHSTAILSRRHRAHLVVGIDKSSHRLGRHPHEGDPNYLLLQAECEDFWRLLAEAGIGIDHHYIFYPNPWPKAGHLQRRVHGGAGFYWLLQLAAGAAPASCARSRIELRSNWQIYVEEFGVAMHLAGHPGRITRIVPDPGLSLFERKYHDSGHVLWAFTGAIGPGLGA